MLFGLKESKMAAGGIKELVSELLKTSRAGGGEGWFGTNPKLSGVNISSDDYTSVDPLLSENKEVRGILGALKKRDLLKRLEILAKTQEQPYFTSGPDFKGPESRDSGQITGLRHIGPKGEALEYADALGESEKGSYLPSYRDWTPYDESTPWGMQTEGMPAARAYEEYANKPSNLLQWVMGLLLGGKDNFKTDLDYRRSGNPRQGGYYPEGETPRHSYDPSSIQGIPPAKRGLLETSRVNQGSY
jgi:hypothetical protein